MTARAAYDLRPDVQLSTDLGTRIVTRHAVAQSFGDFAVTRRFDRHLSFTVGLGTTFNAVNDAKAHYLASGFNYRLTP